MACFPLRVGESIIPLFIAIPMKRSVTGEPTRPHRWIDTQSPVIQKRFCDLAYFIEQGADYNSSTSVPYRVKGKQGRRSLPEGYKPLQVLVQPECGLYRENGHYRANADVLCFYDMDILPFARNLEAYERLKRLMDEGRAFVWMNAIRSPKAAFWVRKEDVRESPQAMLTRIHQEIFLGDPECAPALGPSDMWKTFIHSAQILDGMRVFFEEAYRKHVQAIHDAAMERGCAIQDQHRLILMETLAYRNAQEVDPNQQIAAVPVETPPLIPDQPKPRSGIEAYLADLGEWDPHAPFPDGFNAYLGREFAPRLDHGLQRPLYEEPLPASLFGRKASRLQELALRLALSMSGCLLKGGVGIPSTLVQKLAHQFYPDDFQLAFDESGKLDASGASKAIRQLVKREVLEVTDHSFRPGGMSKRYRAVHPDLIALAQQRSPGKLFSERTVDDVDQRWEEVTGHALAETVIDGTRDQVIYRLTNLCPTYKVFEEAALRIPGMQQRADRVRFLPTQWEAHQERDQRKAQALTSLNAEARNGPEDVEPKNGHNS
jgi:hypothetical protein